VRKVIVEKATPGDVVSQPVFNQKGMVLLPKGTTLTLSLINRLRGWGIREIEVEGEDPNAPPPKSVSELLSDLDHRFRALEGNSLMMELKAIIQGQILAKGGG
jgi:hypothetical protein